MKKLPTVKIGGKTAFVIDRTHIEDDIAVAEAISRDAARWRKFVELWPFDPEDWSVEQITEYLDERI